MSRYIDKDSAIDLSISVLCGGGNEEMAVLVEDINSAPTIEIIRCRECKYWKSTVQMPNGTEVKCLYGRKPNDFCSYGQKGDENVETD